MSFYNPYRWCVALICKNSTLKTPEKLFIKVPNNDSMRYIWLELAGRNPRKYSLKSHLYLCEDHFNLEHDMDNYTQYKIMGSVKKIRMKPNTIPSMFDHLPIVKPILDAESTTSQPGPYKFYSPPPVKAELPEVSPASNQDNEISTPNHDDGLTVKADLSLASEQYNVTPTPDNDDGLMEQQQLEEPDEDNQVAIEEDDVMEDLMYEDILIKTEESIKDVLEPDLHVGYKCNMCESEIRGYVCVQCSDWDMCGGCEARGAHSQHYVLRLPGARPQVEIQSVLDRIRRELMDSTIFIDERIKEEKDDKHTEDPLNEVQNATEVVYTTSELLDDQLNEPLIFEEVSYLEDFEEEIYIQNDTSDPSVSNITNTPLSSSFSASNTTSSVSSTRVSASINTHSASSATHSVSNTQSTASSARLNVSTTSELSDGSSVSNITNTKLSARLSAPNMTLSALNNTCNYKSSNLKGLRLKKNIFKVTECNPIVKVERSDLMKVMSKLKSSQNLSQLRVDSTKQE